MIEERPEYTYTFDDILKLPKCFQLELEKIAYRGFLEETGLEDERIASGIFGITKKALMLRYKTDYEKFKVMAYNGIQGEKNWKI